MKKIRLALSALLAVCLTICLFGCSEPIESDGLDGFNPVGVVVVEKTAIGSYETQIDDLEVTQQLWERFRELEIVEDYSATMGSAYVYLCFYDESQNNLGIFTIYDNGSCCVGENFTTFYTVEDGVQAYLDFGNICEEYYATLEETVGSTEEIIE